MIRIQHGTSRVPFVTTSRRVKWSPVPTGVSHVGRVSEDAPAVANSPRFVAARTAAATVTTGDFSLAVTGRSASFGAGVGTVGTGNSPSDMHRQLFDDTTARIGVTL